MKSRYDKRLGMINIEPVNEREREKKREIRIPYRIT